MTSGPGRAAGRRSRGRRTPSRSRSRSRSASTARPLAVTMRTPGHDEELALGFLHGEGLIDGPRKAGPTADFAANTVEVEGPLLHDPGERRFYTTSSCGVCGKGALEQVAVHARAARRGAAGGSRRSSPSCPSGLDQPGFERTGGLHATGLFTAGGRARRVARGRRPPQRDGQGHRLGADRGSHPAQRVSCSACPAACPSSSSRRPRSPARRSSSASARRRRWPSSSRRTAASRSRALPATGASTCTRARERVR